MSNHERIRQSVGDILQRVQDLQVLVAAPPEPPPQPEPEPQPPPTPQPEPPPPLPPPQPVDIVIRVKPGDDIAAAFDQLQITGGTLLCRPGTYKAHLIARRRLRTSKPVVIRSDTTNLPLVGTRITRDFAVGIAVFEPGGGNGPTFLTENGACNIYFQGVGFGPHPNIATTLAAIGNDKRYMTTLEDTPSGFGFDRVLFWGLDQRGQHAGLRVNGTNITGTGCAFYDFVEPGRDSQAIVGWNGAQSHVWTDCYFEAASENVLYGGSDPASALMNPSNVLFSRCHFGKNPVWNTWSDNGRIKTLFEIKNMKGLRVLASLFEKNWKDSWPSGVAITLKAVNQENTAPFAQCEDIEIADCVIRDCGTVFQLVGWGDSWSATNPNAKTTQRMKNIRLSNILAYNLAGLTFTGEGKGMPAAVTPDDLAVDHITMIQNKHSFHNFWFHGNQRRGNSLSWTNSIMWEGTYGCIAGSPYATDSAPNPPTHTKGYSALVQAAYQSVNFRGNVLAKGGTASPGGWPADNVRLTEAEILSSLDAQKRVKAGSPVANTARTTDGKVVGADIDRLVQALPGVL